MRAKERWRTCGRAALEGIGEALRAMRAAAVPGGAWTNDESDPKMVRAYALGDALEVVLSTGWNFSCACAECSAEDASL